MKSIKCQKVLHIVLIVISILSPVIKTSDLIDAMKTELAHWSKYLPWNHNQYLIAPQTEGDVKVLTIPISQLGSMMDENNLDEKVRERVKAIVYASTITFQGFSFVLSQTIGEINETIGIARKNGSNVELVIMKSRSWAIPIMQFNVVESKHCWTVLFFIEKCSIEKRYIQRGFYTTEIDIIESTLRNMSYTFLKGKLDEIANQYSTFMEIEGGVKQFRGLMGLRETADVAVSDDSCKILYDSAIQNILSEIQENPFIDTLRNNYGSVYQSSYIEKYENIRGEATHKFTDKLLKSIVRDNEYNQIVSIIHSRTVEINKEHPHGLIRIAARNNVDVIYFFEIFIHLDNDDLYDYQVTAITADMPIGSDTILVKMNDDELYKDAINKVNYIGNLQPLMNVFEIMCQSKNEQIVKTNRFLKNKGIVPANPKFPIQSFLGEESSASDTVMNFLSECMKKVQGAWDSLTGLFKNSRSEVVKEKLTIEGFSKFDETAQVQIVAGMKEEGLESFFNLIELRLGVPEGKQSDVRMVLEETKFTDVNAWSCFDLAFSIENGSMIKYASIMSSRGEDGKYYFILTEIQSAFELAQNVVVMTKKLSVLGGIWSDNEDKIEFVPKNLTQDDIQTVFNFFQLVSFKQVANQFGITLNYPQ